MESEIRIVTPIDGYNMDADNRYLIPFINWNPMIDWGKFGFVNKLGEIVIPAQYDYVLDDFIDENSLVRVGERYAIAYERKASTPSVYYYERYGLLKSDGTLLVPIKYQRIYMPISSKRIVLGGFDTGYAVMDFNGNIVVPFGKYHYIDRYCHGIARVKKSGSESGWYRIDENGNEIIR